MKNRLIKLVLTSVFHIVNIIKWQVIKGEL